MGRKRSLTAHHPLKLHQRFLSQLAQNHLINIIGRYHFRVDDDSVEYTGASLRELEADTVLIGCRLLFQVDRPVSHLTVPVFGGGSSVAYQNGCMSYLCELESGSDYESDHFINTNPVN